MALRSLGSSLLAKNRPGSVFREQKEKQIARQATPGKGELGTVSRDLIQEPLERKVPPGSDKVVTVKPTVDETRVEGEPISQQSTPNLLQGKVGRVVGFPTQAPSQAGGQFTASISPNNTPSLSAPSIQTPRAASQAASGGRTATAVSRSGAPGAGVATRTPQVAGAQTSAQAPAQPRRVGFLPTVANAIAGRVAADDPNNPVTNISRGYGDTGVEQQGSQVARFTPTTGQFISGGVGKFIDSVGRALGNPFPEKRLSESLEAFGGAVQPAVEGRGSISKALRSRGFTKKNIRNQARAFVPYLRSLFGR